MRVKPKISRAWFTLNSTRTSLQAATSGGLEIVAVLVTGGGSAAAVRVYDSANGSGEPSPSIDSFLVGANAGESKDFCPTQPAPLTRGLYAELEQGAAFNGEATIFYN